MVKRQAKSTGNTFFMGFGFRVCYKRVLGGFVVCEGNLQFLVYQQGAINLAKKVIPVISSPVQENMHDHQDGGDHYYLQLKTRRYLEGLQNIFPVEEIQDGSANKQGKKQVSRTAPVTYDPALGRCVEK